MQSTFFAFDFDFVYIALTILAAEVCVCAVEEGILAPNFITNLQCYKQIRCHSIFQKKNVLINKNKLRSVNVYHFGLWVFIVHLKCKIYFLNTYLNTK